MPDCHRHPGDKKAIEHLNRNPRTRGSPKAGEKEGRSCAPRCTGKGCPTEGSKSVCNSGSSMTCCSNRFRLSDSLRRTDINPRFDTLDINEAHCAISRRTSDGGPSSTGESSRPTGHAGTGPPAGRGQDLIQTNGPRVRDIDIDRFHEGLEAGGDGGDHGLQCGYRL